MLQTATMCQMCSVLHWRLLPFFHLPEQESSHVSNSCNGLTSSLEASGVGDGAQSPASSHCWAADMGQKSRSHSSPDLVVPSWCGKMQPDAGNYAKSTTVSTNFVEPCNGTAPWSCASGTDGNLPDLHAIMDGIYIYLNIKHSEC